MIITMVMMTHTNDEYNGDGDVDDDNDDGVTDDDQNDDDDGW